MKSGRCFLFAMLAMASASAVSVEPSLPSWSDGERAELEAGGWVAGGLLLTDEPIPDEPEPPAVESLNVAQPTPEEIVEEPTPSDQIPERYWPEYFDTKPRSFLVDPQGLLSRNDYRDRLSFLNYHAGDSSIDLYVYVFKGDQDIPGEVRDEEIVERFYSEGRPAAVVFYYMGAPQRSVMYLSPSLTDAVSAPEQRRALESSVMQAFKDVEPAGQIEAFLVQMSIRMYWMERMLHGDGEEHGIVARTERPRQHAVKKSSMPDWIQPLQASIQPYVLPSGFLLGSLFAGGLTTTLIRRRKRYRFPEFEVEPRLGAAHAAGVGAVISFASAAVPPAAQRDQVPDYLRRA